MKTGLKDLDQMLGDCRGDVIVVGSRSGMGKSCLLRQIAWNHAMESITGYYLLTLQKRWHIPNPS